MDLDEPDHLAEWNRLNIKNAEDSLVSLTFENLIESTKFIDSYSTWLTFGAGATTALLITNTGTVLPFLTATGFKLSGLLLVLSVLCGVLSKLFAIQCQIADAQNESKTNKVGALLKPFYEQAREIREMAKDQKRELDTDLSMERVLRVYLEAFPRWIKWLFLRKLLKSATNPHAGYLLPLRFFRWQSSLMLFQVVFLLAGALCALFFAQSV
ncbi:hypothetical protein [Pseudomonas fragi]|uniref:hypothetical protein n=1 Tax=Pseudomonas fragi TaxID=296 RepID=UPI002D78E03C|nr:hypothetical protein [Pseudomonas fragi]WRT62080.1 hypothetical protein VK847_07040 [Pseudomonas fragi]